MWRKKRQQDEQKDERWAYYLVGVVLVIATVLGVLQWLTGAPVVSFSDPALPYSPTEKECLEGGGDWGGMYPLYCPPDNLCAAVMVERCRCESDNQCSEGYSCIEVDNEGVCSNTSLSF